MVCEKVSVNPTEELEHLFSYGTLQVEAVQLATFGRRLVGEPDALPGYQESTIEIKDADADAIATSGEKYYLNAQFTGLESDAIAGTRFQVTRQELEQSDAYEDAAGYKRISVRLKSGTPAWVYVSESVEP